MRRSANSKTLIEALQNPSVFGADVTAVQLVETHISWVLLTGAYAYKIKKPIELPFLDFTTLELRRHYCDEEIRLNQRLAADLYLGVIPIGGTFSAPRPNEEPAIEFAVKMREFPAEARLDRRVAANAVDEAAIIVFAELIGRFHAGLPPAPADSQYGTADEVLDVVASNVAEAAAVIPDALDSDDSLRSYLDASGRRLRGELEQRKGLGAIKEAHGDLHLENLVAWNGLILAFDALEFDPALRWLDVIDETAFVTMDLIAHGREDLAFCYLNRYLEVSGDYRGLILLRFYMIHRTLVRAKVRAIKAAQRAGEHDARVSSTYLSTARNLLDSGRPMLMITHGLSGSGKTTWTEALITRLPAIRIRSDLERKRLMGLGERDRSRSAVGGGIYTEDSTDATYAALARDAAAGLAGGLNVIVDATFLQRARRKTFAEIAAAAGAGFAILECRADDTVLHRRLKLRRARDRDVSEATAEVLDVQIQQREALDEAERACTLSIDTEHPPAPEQIAASLRKLVSIRNPSAR